MSIRDDGEEREVDDTAPFEPSGEWPGADDRMFAGDSQDWRTDALLSHEFGHRWYVYAEGYKRAADIVVAHVTGTLRDQDFLLYPILFLYRQYLELAIKSLIRSAWELLDEEPGDSLRSHDIGKHWGICRTLVIRVSPGGPVEVLDDVARLIGEFCEHDRTSEAFRYPETTKGDPTLPRLRRVGLRNVQVVMDKIACLLDGIDAMLSAYLDGKAEMRSFSDSGP
ncbi:hypothetical protein LLH23_01485 [bacterium]|nr:hypothetical protein [bacterium]